MFARTDVTVWTTASLIVSMAAFCVSSGCQRAPRLAVPEILVAETETVNLARLRGTRVYVPSATPVFPPVALVDGVTDVDAWADGAGWELAFDGPLVRSRYFDPALDRGADEPVEWAGLRRNFRDGKEYAALGWVIAEFERSHVIDAVSIHSVNTPDLPAHRFGARDVFVHYWDEPTQRWVAVVPPDPPRYREHTVKGNLLPHLAIGFVPVRTDLIRIAIQWTNDTVVTRTFTVMGHPEQYAAGTVRLTEIEVFGMPEEGDVQAETATQQLPEPAEAPETERAPEPAPDADAAIAVVAAYGRAYAEHDLNALTPTIAPTYYEEGEDAAGLIDRLAATFREFPYFIFHMTDLTLHQITASSATISADVWLRLSPLIPTPAEGKITCVLTKIGDDWKIQSIETTPH